MERVRMFARACRRRSHRQDLVKLCEYSLQQRELMMLDRWISQRRNCNTTTILFTCKARENVLDILSST